jgi:hypothetical protein
MENIAGIKIGIFRGLGDGGFALGERSFQNIESIKI